ncbi:uncharacterized protein [Argopecten irradians]|uniref:uncharacterized protein n=1 Tax=Argopecten irradians TaxID=31199 RepID=UPI0037157321
MEGSDNDALYITPLTTPLCRIASPIIVPIDGWRIPKEEEEEETSVPLDPVNTKSVPEPAGGTLRRARYKVYTCIGVSLFLAEVILVIYTVNHLLDTSNSLEQGNTTSRTAVTYVNCNRSTPCTLIQRDSYITLVKLMSGLQRQHDIIRPKTRSRLRSHYRTNCEHFTLSGCPDGNLRWTPDFHRKGIESNGSVTIRTNGTYGMYSMITLSSQHQNYPERVKVIHRVHLHTLDRHYRNGSVLFEKDTLLHSHRKHYDSSTIFDFVYLREGDRVYPTISNTSFVYNMQLANTWGVFQVK